MNRRFMMMGKLIVDGEDTGWCDAIFNITTSGPVLDYINHKGNRYSAAVVESMGKNVELQLEHIVSTT